MAGPFNFEVETARLKRQQELADALESGAMSGSLSTGGGLGGLLTAILRPMKVNRLRNEVDTGYTALQNRYKQELGTELENYMRTRSSRDKELWSQPDLQAAGQGAGVPQLSPEVIPGDPRRAAATAMASQFPQLQALGKADMEGMRKNELSPKDLLGLTGIDKKTALAAALAKAQGYDDASVLPQLSPENKQHIVNGQIVELPGGGGGPRTLGDYRDQYSGVGPVAMGPDGRPIIGQAERTTGKVHFAPQGTNVNVNTQQKAGEKFAGQLAEERAKIIAKSYDNSQAAAKSLSAIDSASQQLQAGMKTGSLADLNMAVSKLGTMLGMSSDPAVVNTETYRAAIAQQVAQMVKNFGAGTGISDADRKFAEAASGGQISGEPGALLRILSIAKVAAGNVLAEHDRLLSSNRDASGALPADLKTFEIPFSVSAGQAGQEDVGYNPAMNQFRLQASNAGGKAPKPRVLKW